MRISEIYTSIQGEGPNTGAPITFVRFGGCNLRCAGWGTGVLPDGTPVGSCDTAFAVYPQYSSAWKKTECSEVLSEIPRAPKHVCFTGGEPLTQRVSELNELADKLLGMEYRIDLFTNGTIDLRPFHWTIMSDHVTVVMDYKLPGSEEFRSFSSENFNYLREKDALKFVCKNEEDFTTALETIDHYLLDKFPFQIWFGVVWGEWSEADLATSLQHHYPQGRMNVQTHKYIWDPDERSV